VSLTPVTPLLLSSSELLELLLLLPVLLTRVVLTSVVGTTTGGWARPAAKPVLLCGTRIFSSSELLEEELLELLLLPVLSMPGWRTRPVRFFFPVTESFTL